MEFRILGPLELWVDGTQCRLGTLKERCVLAMLLDAAGAPVSVDTLIDRLWDGRPPRSATQTLHTYMARLRSRLHSALGQQVRVSRSARTYRLQVEEGLVDLHRFRALVKQAQTMVARGENGPAIALLREAEALWRGEPFCEFPGEWAVNRQRRLVEERRAGRELCITLELDEGHHHDLVGELREMAADHPGSETIHRQLMLALYRCGRHSESLEVFRGFRLWLRERGLFPGPAMEGLHQQILKHDTAPLRVTAAHPPVASLRPPDSLVRDVDGFTGRRDEMRTLLEDRPPTGTALPLIVIHGMAGVGKTALAVHVGHLMGDRYPDGRYFVELGAHGPQPARDPDEVLAGLLQENGTESRDLPQGLAERRALWRRQMAGRRALLILDDAQDAAQVRLLLPGAPTCRVIVTSRRHLAALEGARSLALEVPGTAEAVDLFTRIAGRPRTSDRDALHRVVNLCDRHPLALQLSASQLRHRGSWDLDDLAERLTETLGVYSGVGAAPNVASAFEVSYAGLTDFSRGLFRFLALHPGPDLTEHVGAALSGADVSLVRRGMDELVDCHLLEEPVRNRYCFHDLVRNFALGLGKRTQSESERRDAVQRLLDYFLAVAARADDLAHPQCRRPEYELEHPPAATPALLDADDGGSWLDVERSNLLAVASTAAVESPKHACLFPLLLARAFGTWGAWNATGRLFEKAHRIWRDREDRKSAALCLVWWSEALWNQGAHEEAARYAEEALEIGRSARDRSTQAEALLKLGKARLVVGERESALECYDEALAIYRGSRDVRGEAAALNLHGVASGRAGQYRDAEERFRAMLAIEEGIGDRHGVLKALNNIGEIYRLQGRNPEALAYFKRSLRVARSVGGRQQLANLYTNLGLVCRATGDLDQALGYFVRAMDSYQESRDLRCLADCLINIGATYREGGQDGAALTYLRRGERLAREIGDHHERQTALVGIADVHRAFHRKEQAMATYREAVELARQIDALPGLAEALDGLARTHAEAGEAAATRRCCEEAMALYLKLEDRQRAEAMQAMLAALEGGG